MAAFAMPTIRQVELLEAGDLRIWEVVGERRVARADRGDDLESCVVSGFDFYGQIADEENALRGDSDRLSDTLVAL